MNLRNPFSRKRGSALLIVLGLLGFLMISAVAFSISMRTERAAAASFRSDVRTRDLLAMAFADARSTLEGAMVEQRGSADPANNPDDRRVEYIAPFRVSENSYARLISSRPVEDGLGGAAVAYLIDDAVMAHVPPYIASNVFSALEPPLDGATAGASTGRSYAYDAAACWRPIYATIPEVDVGSDSGLEDRSRTLVGRMAWAVVNLSDTVDINGIGSFSPYRGLGLTGNEFAFGKAPGATADTDTRTFDLVESSADESGELQPKLPVFLSNADLYTYASMTDEGNLKPEGTDGILSYSWQDAALYSGDGEGYYSPFSVYSFWPTDRKNEEGDLITTDDTAGNAPSCDEVRPEDLGTGSELVNRIEQALSDAGVSNAADIRDSLARLLTDYLDTDSEPCAIDLRAGADEAANAFPSVENVPMVMEVGYDAAQVDSAIGELLQKAIEPMEGTKKENLSLADAQSLLSTFDEDLSIESGELPLTVNARTYFPGYETASDAVKGADVKAEGYILFTAAVAGSGRGETEIEPVSSEIDGVSLGGVEENVYSASASATLDGSSPEVDLTGKIPTGAQGEGVNIPAEDVTVTVLIDYFFRVRIDADGICDLAPAEGDAPPSASDMPSSLRDRLNESTMKAWDSYYFRVSRAAQIKFRPVWQVTKNDGGDPSQEPTYTAELTFDGDPQLIQGADGANEQITIGGQTFSAASQGGKSLYSYAPAQGVWKTVDPRYNWLSPMLGSSGSAVDYGTDAQNALVSYSSPHWFFLAEAADSGREVLLADSYAEQHAAQVPFSFGLTWDNVRYGTNDSGRLYLPGEVGFLPVPFHDTVWTPSGNYNSRDLSDYYNRVARCSYFRTMPVTEFNDGAFDGNGTWDEERATKMTRLFRRFAAPGFPEEHRAIMSVFAAQDNYALAQRLRQFAMCGIMPSIREAAAVTRARLETAQSAGRINIENFDEVFPRIEGVTLGKPKYDTFICRYLFPLPGEEASGAGFSSSASPEVWPTGARPQDVNFLSDMSEDAGSGTSVADRIVAYNGAEGAAEPLGQNDLTTLLSVAGECFGDRQQLFLYILRADSVAAVAGTESLGDHTPLATARAVALVWRDAYGLLPDRVVYYQVLP